MDNITTIVLAIFASTGFWAFISQVYTAHKKMKTPQDEMLLALGRDRLLHLSKEYMSKGYIPDDEYDTFKAMGEAYIAMDGNSSCKRKYLEAINQLSVRG